MPCSRPHAIVAFAVLGALCVLLLGRGPMAQGDAFRMAAHMTLPGTPDVPYAQPTRQARDAHRGPSRLASQSLLRHRSAGWMSRRTPVATAGHAAANGSGVQRHSSFLSSAAPALPTNARACASVLLLCAFGACAFLLGRPKGSRMGLGADVLVPLDFVADRGGPAGAAADIGRNVGSEDVWTAPWKWVLQGNTAAIAMLALTGAREDGSDGGRGVLLPCLLPETGTGTGKSSAQRACSTTTAPTADNWCAPTGRGGGGDRIVYH